MTSQLIQRIRSQCKPLLPKQTDLEPSLQSLADIRAVLFDIYGTLMISASGDIGSNSGEHRVHALTDVAKAFGLKLNCSATAVIAEFERKIQSDHNDAQESGVSYPEVEIRDIWEHVLNNSTGDSANIDFAAFAIEYETRVNPTWPMPDLGSVLSDVTDFGMVMGIVSNAQFFTPLLFPALLNKDLGECGFAPNLLYFSYEHKRAKPGTFLYETAKRDLAKTGISENEVLYVGNDMLNDVAAAHSVGFRTALFAGDKRSLRLRSDDERVHGVEADIVVTELPQIIECLPTK